VHSQEEEHVFALIQASPETPSGQPDTTVVRVGALVLLVIIVAIIIMRRKKKKKVEDEF
jgi:hypothetical protein